MEKEFWKGGTLLSPVPPAMVSCGTMEKPNIITIAWTGIVNSDPPMTYVSVRPERYSYDLIANQKEFVINITTEELVAAADWCGVKSGREVNKFEEQKLTPVAGQKVSVPLIGESPINLECKVTQVLPLGSHHMFLAEIVGVHVSKKALDANGKLCIERCMPVAYAHGSYFSLQKVLGTFGYTVRKKPLPPKRSGGASPKKKG